VTLARWAVILGDGEVTLDVGGVTLAH